MSESERNERSLKRFAEACKKYVELVKKGLRKPSVAIKPKE